MVLNCAAIQPTIAETELFGHERGAFTDAAAARPGLIESANGGTVFLDEIGELSPSIQAKLLRVLDTRQVMRVGSTRERAIDFRLVAATHRDLRDDVRTGRFREDLFFRLNGVVLSVPALRRRPRELPILARMFLTQACSRVGRPAMTIHPDALAELAAFSWPGNVRQLKNVMSAAAAMHPDDELQAEHLAPWLREHVPAREFRPVAEELRELEAMRMREALAATNGNSTRAAALIGMPVRTFFAKAKQYKLRDE
jgi:DNA-binding NtrC family response regulator